MLLTYINLWRTVANAVKPGRPRLLALELWQWHR
jgi:hypothetical protein